jgi:hypothetical protein
MQRASDENVLTCSWFSPTLEVLTCSILASTNGIGFSRPANFTTAAHHSTFYLVSMLIIFFSVYILRLGDGGTPTFFSWEQQCASILNSFEAMYVYLWEQTKQVPSIICTKLTSQAGQGRVEWWSVGTIQHLSNELSPLNNPKTWSHPWIWRYFPLKMENMNMNNFSTVFAVVSCWAPNTCHPWAVKLPPTVLKLKLMWSSQNYKLPHTIVLQQSPSSTDQCPSQNSQKRIESPVGENGFPSSQTLPQAPSPQMFHNIPLESLLGTPVYH